MTNYWEYLKLDRLLALQSGLDPEGSEVCSDELHFIVLHQISELWFKLILSEMRMLRDALMVAGPTPETMPELLHRLDRINKTLTAATQQFAVMETLKPQDFLDFRDKLVPASASQSFQFPEIEILMGLEEALPCPNGAGKRLDHISKMADRCPAAAMAHAHVEHARKETTLRSALYEWLCRWPIPHSRDCEDDADCVIDEFLESYLETIRTYHAMQMSQLMTMPGADRAAIEARFSRSFSEAREFAMALDVPESQRQFRRRVRASVLYIETYSDSAELGWARMVIDSFLEMESALLLWRARHARMAERMIGRRVGTGGSSVAYLDQTLGPRVFADLWAARSQVVPAYLAPGCEDRVLRSAIVNP